MTQTSESSDSTEERKAEKPPLTKVEEKARQQAGKTFQQKGTEVNK